MEFENGFLCYKNYFIIYNVIRYNSCLVILSDIYYEYLIGNWLNTYVSGVFELQGQVIKVRVNITGLDESVEHVYESGTTSAIIGKLQPSISYTVSLTLVTHGGATITSEPVNVKTQDGGETCFFKVNYTGVFLFCKNVVFCVSDFF